MKRLELCTNCVPSQQEGPEFTKSKKVKGIKTGGSVILSCLIAFFPKCPICWATYMSLFTGIGLSNIPYQRWLLPVFAGILLIHLLLLAKNVKSKGYGPILISAFGFLLLIISKFYYPEVESILYVGIVQISIGSLWNGFTISPNSKIFKLTFNIKNHE